MMSHVWPDSQYPPKVWWNEAQFEKSWEYQVIIVNPWPLHLPSLWFPFVSVSNHNTRIIAPFWCVRNETLLSCLLTDMMRRGKKILYLFSSDSSMLLLAWKPLPEATAGQTNIYSRGIIKQTNTGREQNIWALNTDPGILQSWMWKQAFAFRDKDLWTAAVRLGQTPLKTNCCSMFQKTDLLPIFGIYKPINH